MHKNVELCATETTAAAAEHRSGSICRRCRNCTFARDHAFCTCIRIAPVAQVDRATVCVTTDVMHSDESGQIEELLDAYEAHRSSQRGDLWRRYAMCLCV